MVPGSDLASSTMILHALQDQCAILYINGPGKIRGTGTVAATFTVLSKEQYMSNTVMVTAFRYLFCTFQGTVPVHKEALLWLQSSGTCSG